VTCATGRFPPASRLRTSADFKAVFASSQRSSDSQFTILACANGLQCPRLGFAIARSRIRSAVVRNRLKRIVREYFRTHRELFGAVDMVVMAQSRADVNDSEKLRASLRKHSEKVAACAPR